jgi:N-acyl homoserine lactone hydrolase
MRARRRGSLNRVIFRHGILFIVWRRASMSNPPMRSGFNFARLGFCRRMHHFPRSRIYVADGEYKNALGLWGKLNGYLPHRWPKWFAPVPIPFMPTAFGGFARSFSVTTAGDVVVVPTPGHTPNHVSVIVKTSGLDYFLAGDTSYTERQLLERRPDGVSTKPKVTVATIGRICDYLSSTPTVYLPSHDPDSAVRLRDAQVTNCDR